MFCKSLALLVFCSAWHAAESYAGYMLEDKYCKKLMMVRKSIHTRPIVGRPHISLMVGLLLLS